jgi:pilus assembly protein FimV
VTRNNKKILPLFIGAGLLSGSLANAAQLGKLEVLSSENQPLVAEIKIESVQPSERESLKATLANEAAFKAARLSLDPSLKGLKFKVVDGVEPNTAVLRISSDKAFPAGFVDALIELSWAGGRVAREYTLSVPVGEVTPPKMDNIPAILPPMTLPSTTKPAEKADANKKVVSDQNTKALEIKTVEKKPPSSPVEKLHPGASFGGLLIKQGDTLSEIALEMVGNGITLTQAMAAIYEANPDAFIHGSVHLIKQGVRIQVPNRSALIAKSNNESLLILAKNDDRNVYSVQARQLGLLTVANQEQAVETQKPNTGVIEKAEKSTASAKVQVDRLQIAPGNAAASADRSAEELLAKNKALAEANERIALLEKNVSDLQHLLEMQNESSSSTAESSSEKLITDSKVPNEPKSAPANELESEKMTSAQETAKQVQEAAKDKTDHPVDVKAPLTEEKKEKSKQPLPEKELETAWYASPWFFGGLGGSLGLALCALLLLKWRKRKEPLEFSTVPENTEQSADSFDEALAWASEPVQEEAIEKRIDTVESEEFNLDELLDTNDAELKPTPTGEQTVLIGVSDEESIPDLGEESPEASAQADSLHSDVDLDFPEDSPKNESSIMDDLDSLEKGALAAQDELNELRKNAPQPKPEEDVSAAFDDLVAANNSAVQAPEDESVEPELPTPVPEDDFEKAVADLDLDVPNPAVDEATWQEVATKLDLAGAYVEIGDADGAKELLNEIIQKGDVDQVRKAKSLIASLG